MKKVFFLSISGQGFPILLSFFSSLAILRALCNSSQTNLGLLLNLYRITSPSRSPLEKEQQDKK